MASRQPFIDGQRAIAQNAVAQLEAYGSVSPQQAETNLAGIKDTKAVSESAKTSDQADINERMRQARAEAGIPVPGLPEQITVEPVQLPLDIE